MTGSDPVDAFVSVGSNVQPEKNLRLAWRELGRRFPHLRSSPVYRTAAVGFDGDPFLNCVFAFATTQPAPQLVATLEELHRLAGRERGPDAFAPRSLDLDLLLYGDAVMPEAPVRVPREDIERYAFVLRPLAELAPSLRHPVLGSTMAELWSAFPGRDEPMEAVALDLGSPA